MPPRSRPVVGSSSTSSDGCGIKACASSTRCRSPPDKLPSLRAELAGQPQSLERPLDLRAPRPRHAEKHGPALGRHRHEVTHRDRQALVEIERLRHVADDFVVVPLDADASCVRHLAEQRPHERGLAAAVGADDAMNRAGANLEAHVLQDRRGAERQVDALELDRWTLHGLLTALARFVDGRGERRPSSRASRRRISLPCTRRC